MATSVGMAIAGKWMAKRYNRPDFEMFDFNTYAVCGDGCMMEGISGEAASLAGHLKLNNLCWIYDNNQITIEGNTSWPSAKTWPRASSATAGTSRGSATPTTWMIARARFQDLRGRATVRPSSSSTATSPTAPPNKQDTSAAHGEPLGEEEIKLTKRNYGWPEDAKFLVPEEVPQHFQEGRAAAAATCAKPCG